MATDARIVGHISYFIFFPATSPEADVAFIEICAFVAKKSMATDARITVHYSSNASHRGRCVLHTYDACSYIFFPLLPRYKSRGIFHSMTSDFGTQRPYWRRCWQTF